MTRVIGWTTSECIVQRGLGQSSHQRQSSNPHPFDTQFHLAILSTRSPKQSIGELMDIRTLCLCRNAEYVFEEVEISGMPSSHQIAPIINDPASPAFLPLWIYPLNDDADSSRPRYLFMYPLLPINSSSYAIGEFSSSGSLCSKTVREVNYGRIKWISRFNYRSNRRRCFELQELSSKQRPLTQEQISFTDIIATPTHIKVRGIVREPYDYTSAPPKLICLNENLCRVDSGFVLMKCQRNAPTSASTFYVEWPFSFQVPWNERRLFVCGTDETGIRCTSTKLLSRDTREEMIHLSDQRFHDIAPDFAYQAWRKRTAPTSEKLIAQRAATFSIMPLYSVIVPLYNTPKDLFLEMVDSVRNQTYQKWELILVNSSPDLNYLQSLIDKSCLLDNRVRSITLDSSKGISLNTNAGIKIARGDFISFFDHDDLLDPSILFEYTKAINEYPDTDVLYCDEDKLTPDGQYVGPTFKPDFSIDLLCNNNYVCHMLTIRMSLLGQLTPNTPEYDGAQDHNMTLKAAEKARRIHHVPKILYHWRMAENSTAANPDNKPYAAQAGIRSVQDHFARLNVPVEVSNGPRPFVYRVNYLIPGDHPLVSIVIPTCGDSHLLSNCLTSINNAVNYDNVDVIIVGSSTSIDSIHSVVDSFRDIMKWSISRVILPGSFSLSAAFNYGANISKGDYYLFLHDDVMLTKPFSLEHLVGACSRDDIGAVGVRLFYPDETIQHAGYYLTKNGDIRTFSHAMPRGRWGAFCLPDAQRNVTAVSSACMLTKSSIFAELGGFDSTYKMCYEDIDYCLCLREHGLLVLFTPEAEATHYDNPYIEQYPLEAHAHKQMHLDYASLLLKWDKIFLVDDCNYNCNLDLL